MEKDGELVHLSSKDTSMISISINESTTVRELFEMMLTRWWLASDRSDFSDEDIPVAVLTIMVNGLNLGFNDPGEVEVAVAIWDGLDEEEKIMLLNNKKRHEIVEDDYEAVEKFNLFKLNRMVNAFSQLYRGSVESE